MKVESVTIFRQDNSRGTHALRSLLSSYFAIFTCQFGGVKWRNECETSSCPILYTQSLQKSP